MLNHYVAANRKTKTTDTSKQTITLSTTLSLSEFFDKS
jgi:hypothetical protein